MKKETYSLKKSHHILHASYSLLQKKGKELTPLLQRELEQTLRLLEDALFSKDREQASELAKKAEETTSKHFKKSFLRYSVELAVAILVALLIATVVRQMWFENYEIPTGSMRPSFREKDRLIVTKTAFGLNVPLKTEHYYFDPDLVERGKALIFSGANIPSLDEVTKYFGIFPYTKRYVKRLIGKPGDTLYFYGGKIYGVDKEGKPILELLEDPWMEKLEHIPLITFEGTVTTSKRNEILFKHMNQAIGKLTYTPFGSHQGDVFVNGKWTKEKLFKKTQSQRPNSYRDFWGIGNYAMARLLNRQELQRYTDFDPEKIGPAELYLQLKHTPNLTYPPPIIYQEGRHVGIQMPAFETVIPLTKDHLKAIMKQMYTSRFIVKNGSSSRYSAGQRETFSSAKRFADVPDGTYEFVNGRAEKVGVQGWTTSLPSDHPLNRFSKQHVKTLFNLGIGMWGTPEQSTFFQNYYPHRYAYWRNGDLYLLSAPILKKSDPVLKKFIKNEQAKERGSTPDKPYLAFKDTGSPVKSGEFDIDFIQNFGIKVPEKHYLALGDNHANSKDSRFFGFVPEENIQGAPDFLFWPPGPRWGGPPQTPYPFLTLPRVIIWTFAALILFCWYLFQKHRRSKRLFPKKKQNGDDSSQKV